MISKNTIKLINSLAYKKYRQKENLFLAEGEKNVIEILHSDYEIVLLFADDIFIGRYKNKVGKAVQIIEASKQEIKKISMLKTPPNCLALCKIPSIIPFPEILNDTVILYLDGIQDPGNLGTIIRICDWFGIKNLFCSPDSADIYNPKVIQSSMGSFCRINTWYSKFDSVASLAKSSNMTILGAYLEGSDIYKNRLSEKTLLIVGNEGKGIRKELENFIDTKITIPGFSEKNRGAESLNAAVATGIICAEIKRQYSFSGYSK